MFKIGYKWDQTSENGWTKKNFGKQLRFKKLKSNMVCLTQRSEN